MSQDLNKLRQAALQLGHVEPISIEPDGTIWLGLDANRVYLTDAQLKAVQTEAAQIDTDAAAARASGLTKLAGLGLTADEIAALVGQ